MMGGLIYWGRRLRSQESCLFYWLLCSSQRWKNSVFSLSLAPCHSSEHKATSLRDAFGLLHYVFAKKGFGCYSRKAWETGWPIKEQENKSWCCQLGPGSPPQAASLGPQWESQTFSGKSERLGKLRKEFRKQTGALTVETNIFAVEYSVVALCGLFVRNSWF